MLGGGHGVAHLGGDGGGAAQHPVQVGRSLIPGAVLGLGQAGHGGFDILGEGDGVDPGVGQGRLQEIVGRPQEARGQMQGGQLQVAARELDFLGLLQGFIGKMGELGHTLSCSPVSESKAGAGPAGGRGPLISR